MRQVVALPSDIPLSVALFIKIWKERKGYGNHESLTLGEVIELIIATSHNLHHEDSDGRFFNNILINAESTLSWDGEELIETLLHEAIENIKKRFKSSFLY